MNHWCKGFKCRHGATIHILKIKQLPTQHIITRPRIRPIRQVKAKHNIVGCKWVYKLGGDANCNISRYKARLVAQGFSQQPGTDFDEIFSPVVRYDSLRLLTALSISLGWQQPDQLDIKGAFLYGYLNEEIYMKLPPGYKEHEPPAGFCARLNKSIYGLKQSPRQWYQRLTGFLIPLGFVTTNFDPCVLIHRGHQLIIAIYVDDITIAGFFLF